MGSRSRLQIFKIAISSACHPFGASHSHLRKARGIDAFELQTDFNSSPKTIAASALMALCARDGSYLDGIICVAVIDFLDETIGPPHEDEDRTMRMTALRDIVVGVG